MKANIFDIYRGTTHDGPGLRTTIFFRGCPLCCAWCHNPEGISLQPYIWWDGSRCIGCGTCQKVCPQKAIQFTQDGLQIHPEQCSQCGLCLEHCPSKALEAVSRNYSLEEILSEVTKDFDFYTQFHGGVTASGGEAMLQCDFVAQLFMRLKEQGIHTALDTCGNVPFEFFQRIMPYTDCVLYDLKVADPILHQRYTGRDNKKILDNFYSLIEAIRTDAYSGAIWIRTPLIPHATATEQNIKAIAQIIKPYLGKEISRWEMCSFNNACTKKYRKLHIDWEFENEPLLEKERGEALRKIAQEVSLNNTCIFLTGILR